MRYLLGALFLWCASQATAQTSLKLTGLNASGERETVGWLIDDSMIINNSDARVQVESYLTPDGYTFYLVKGLWRLTDPFPSSAGLGPPLFFTRNDCSQGAHFATDERDTFVYRGAIFTRGGMGLRMSRRTEDIQGIYTRRARLSGGDCVSEPEATSGGYGLTMVNLGDYGFRPLGSSWFVIEPEWVVDRVNGPVFCDDFESCPVER